MHTHNSTSNAAYMCFMWWHHRCMGSTVQRQHSGLCSPNTISEVSTFARSYWEVIVTGLSRWSFLSGLVLLYPAWINKGWISRLQPKDVHDKGNIQCLRDFLKHNLYLRAKLRKNTVVLPILQMKKGIYCIYISDGCSFEEVQGIKSNFWNRQADGNSIFSSGLTGHCIWMNY